MRLNINLATKPYQDVQRILMQWGSLVALLALCTVALAWTAIASYRQSRDVNAKIAAVNREIASLDHERAEAISILNMPQNSSVVENSKFLNGLIARKSFSWTRVFMQLEEIMPPRLHVVSIQPELQPVTNTMLVHLRVAGGSREAAVELVKRLEQSPSFRDATISEETRASEHEGPELIQFDLTAVYVPKDEPVLQNTSATQPSMAQSQAGVR